MLLAVPSFIGCGDDIDYIATVKQREPFKNSQNLPGTYNNVVVKYINSPEWTTRESGNDFFVDIKGKVKGEGESIVITIKTVYNKDTDNLSVSPYSVTFDGETITGNDAVEFMFYMFDAYNDGFETLEDYFNAYY